MPNAKPCTDDYVCQEAFGFMWGCEAGYCVEAEPFARCSETTPDGVLVGQQKMNTLIGFIDDLSLPAVQARRRAVLLAFKQANDEGGLSGQFPTLVTCTTEADGVRDKLSATEAAAAAADFLGKVLHVPAILGPTDTPQVESVFSALAALGSSAVIMAGAATGDALTTLDTETPGRVWRTSASDALHAKAIVSDMRTPGPGRTAAVTRVAVVFADNAYGQGLKQAFTTELTAQGGTVAASCPFTPSDNASVAAAAAAASDGSANAEEVLLIAQDADTVAFMAAVAPLSSYDAKGIFLSDPRDYIALLASDSTRFAAVRGTRPGGWSQTETTYRNFATAYGTAYGTDPAIFSNVANTFDAAWLVLYGMAFARGKQFQLTAANVAEGLTHLSGGGTSQQRIAIIADNWSAVTRVLQAGQYVDVRGASGELNFDATTEEATTTFDVWTLTPTKLLSVQYVWQPAS